MDNQMMTTHRAWRAALIATLLLTAATAPAAEKVTYYHLDALGSPVAATDFLGAVVWRETYQPYGERIQNSPAAADNARWYTGHVQDADTGLVYAGARYYDPVVGRFMAVDPVAFTEKNVHSFNRYAYANNNPYKYVDPDGADNVAVVDSQRASTSGDISGYKGQYTIYDYTVYDVPGWVPVSAQPAVGRLFGEEVGRFSISWDARSPAADNRGTVLGDKSKMAEVSLGSGRHPIRVTDIGQSMSDTLTQTVGGKDIIRENERLHWGGPYGSKGCGTVCDPAIGLSKGGTEKFLVRQMPSLKRTDERTLIQLPAAGN